MLDAPQQNWPLYASMTREADAAWLRGLTPTDRFLIYADLFNLIVAGRSAQPSGERLEQLQWRGKRETRQRLVGVLNQWDQWRRDRTAATHAG